LKKNSRFAAETISTRAVFSINSSFCSVEDACDVFPPMLPAMWDSLSLRHPVDKTMVGRAGYEAYSEALEKTGIRIDLIVDQVRETILSSIDSVVVLP
jgi:hypothetical protein